jgi:hypothetical protein
MMWNKIQEKYPEALKEWCKYYNQDFMVYYTNAIVEYFSRMETCELIGKIEDFFDSRGIYIESEVLGVEDYQFLVWSGRKIWQIERYESRQEAREAAIEKAFEILERGNDAKL